MRLSIPSPSSTCRYLNIRPAHLASTSLLSSKRTFNDPAQTSSRLQKITPPSRQFSSSTSKMASDALFDAIKSRRTYYALSGESPIPDKKIHEIVTQAVTHVPSSFNSQSTRVLVLLNEEHKKLWGDIVIPIIKSVAPPEAWPASEKKLEGFKAGYGTILFYEEPKDVAKLQEQYPLYADKFPQWSEHTNAMHQYACKCSTRSLLEFMLAQAPVSVLSSRKSC